MPPYLRLWSCSHLRTRNELSGCFTTALVEGFCDELQSDSLILGFTANVLPLLEEFYKKCLKNRDGAQRSR